MAKITLTPQRLSTLLGFTLDKLDIKEMLVKSDGSLSIDVETDDFEEYEEVVIRQSKISNAYLQSKIEFDMCASIRENEPSILKTIKAGGNVTINVADKGTVEYLHNLV